MNLPTKDDLAKLYALVAEYAELSNVEMSTFHAAKQRLNDDYKAAANEPEVRAAKEGKERIYPQMEAERELLNEKFPGLDLFGPAGFVGWGGGPGSYYKHVDNQIVDLAAKHWETTVAAELAELRELVRNLREQDAAAFKAGEYAFQPSRGMFQVVKPFKRMARATEVTTKSPTKIEGRYKLVPAKLAVRVLALHNSKLAYISERGLVAA